VGPRLLHRHSQFGYTRSVHEGLFAEPEAVSAEEQRRLSEQAQRRAQARRRDDWAQVRGQLLQLLSQLAARPLGRELVNELRAMRRTIDRIDRRVQAGRPGG
jgi:hypothetical protein